MATRLEQPRRPSSPIRYWSTRTARDADRGVVAAVGFVQRLHNPTGRRCAARPSASASAAPWVAPSAGTSPDGSTPPFHPSRRLDWKPRKEASARLGSRLLRRAGAGPRTSKTRSSRPRGASRSPRSERSWSRARRTLRSRREALIAVTDSSDDAETMAGWVSVTRLNSANLPSAAAKAGRIALLFRAGTSGCARSPSSPSAQRLGRFQLDPSGTRD